MTVKLIGTLLKRFFLLLYHQFAWSYDLVSWTVSLGRWKAWVEAVVPFLPGPKILEVGHGPGHLQAALYSRGIWSCGLDESRWMSAIASKRSSRLVSGLAQKLPFSNEAFSQVVATFPAEFIFEVATLTEIFRVLEPEGNFVLLPIAWITGKRFFERMAAWLFRFTGEAPEKTPDLISKYFSGPLEQAHFQVSSHIIEIGSSEILLIIAQKSKMISDSPSPQRR
jgi:ubiquinone/menaquinone biosynthesis C-methylase UbiE